jgi:hypothetical protein
MYKLCEGDEPVSVLQIKFFLMLMLWSYMNRDTVSLPIAMCLLWPAFMYKLCDKDGIFSALFKKFSWCTCLFVCFFCACCEIICTRIKCYLALDLLPSNILCWWGCLIFIYAKMNIEIKTLYISLLLSSRKRVFGIFLSINTFCYTIFCVFCKFYGTDLGF